VANLSSIPQPPDEPKQTALQAIQLPVEVSVEAIACSGQPIRHQVREYVNLQLAEYLKTEIGVAGIAAIIVGALTWLAGAATLNAAIWALLALFATFIGAALVHWLRAPYALLAARDKRYAALQEKFVEAQRLLEEPKPKIEILYDDNDETYNEDSVSRGTKISYKNRLIALRCSKSGTAVLFIPKVKTENAGSRSMVYLKPAAHQSEELEAGFASYWYVVQMNSLEKTIKLLRKGGEQFLLGSKAEFELVARCAGAEDRVMVRTRIVETPHKGTDATGRTVTVISYDLEFRLYPI
jgi:membrane protein implicated in regulation of membrane protease activity